MSAVEEKCRYEHELYVIECPHPVYRDGFCIFHLPKPDKSELEPGTAEYEKYQEIRNKFLREFEKLVKATEEDESANHYDFQGFVFPEINLSGTIFKKKADFCYAKFQQKAGFIEVQFNQGSYFNKVEFLHRSYFINTKFLLEAAFIGANFHQKADFTGVNFQKEAVFKRAKFKQKSDFKWSEFRQLADFSRAKFEQDADFSRAKFQQEVEFSMVTFQQEADFRWAKFEGRVLFEGGIDNRCFHGPLLFNGVETGEKAKVIFNKVDLGRASFTDTDIENFTFRDVHWYRPKTGKLWLIREKALFDEFRHLHPEAGNEDEPPEEVDYSKLAENYSQLVLNHEKKRDFLSAHEFRIGEMEARRKDIGARAGPRWRKVREWLNAYALYGFLSNYGTSYWRALLVLALMLLAFAGLFFFSGFRPLSPEGAPLAAVSYDWSLDPGPLRQAIHDFWKAVLFALSVLTLQRGRFYVPAGELTQVWIFLAAIFFYSQVTLLLLAVRRRFKQ